MSQPTSVMPPLSRFAFMATGWGAIGVVYTISGLRSADAAFLLTPSAIDLWFGFAPSAIWVYMSFFAFVPFGFFVPPPDRVKWLRGAMWVSAVSAGIIFALFPTTMAYPTVTQAGLSAEALKLLMRFDAVVNCLPSLHVTLTALVLCAIWENGRHWRNLLVTVWAASIAISILPLHRHQFVDLVAGLALALFACAFLAYLKHYRLVSWKPAQ